MAAARLYHPLDVDVAHEMISVRLRGRHPMTFSGRLREITTPLDPCLQLREILPLDTVLRAERGMQLGALGIALVTFSVLLLAAAALYALMSFAVSQRKREIGNPCRVGRSCTTAPTTVSNLPRYARSTRHENRTGSRVYDFSASCGGVSRPMSRAPGAWGASRDRQRTAARCWNDRTRLSRELFVADIRMIK